MFLVSLLDLSSTPSFHKMAIVLNVKDSQPNWTTLPVEILHKTFSLLERKSLYETVHVCKSWTNSAQAALYSNVVLHTFYKFSNFITTMRQKPILGLYVKYFKYFSYEEDLIDVGVITKSLLLSGSLPNVEVFETRKNGVTFELISNALQNSRLKRLTKISAPSLKMSKSEVEHYITCATLMKDRLRSLCICDNYGKITQPAENKLYFQRLYSQLHQFDKLNDLTIITKTKNEIQVLEYVAEACKTLENISFEFTTSNNKSIPVSVINTASEMVPRSNVKTMKGSLYNSSFSKFLPYIINKFPQLREVSLTVKSDNITIEDDEIILLLYMFLSKLQNGSVSIPRVRPEALCDSIGYHWNSGSRLGSEDVSLYYEQTPIPDPTIGLYVTKYLFSKETTVYFRTSEWMHISFIENYGIYIGRLKFGFMEDDINALTDLQLLPENFMGHLVKHCPYLKSLSIEGSVLKPPSYHGIDLSKKLSLWKLTFRFCIIYAGVLEHLSLLVPEVDVLRLGFGVTYRQTLDASSTPVDNIIQIIMPHTKIHKVHVELLDQDEPVYFQVYSTDAQKYYHFMCFYNCDEVESILEVSRENSFIPGVQIYLCCKNVPRFGNLKPIHQQ